VIYLDPSAIVLLVENGHRGRSLARWLNDRIPGVVLTSVLSEVEATGRLRREHPELLVHLPAVLRATSRYEVDPDVRTLAGALAGKVGIAAAIHVATALVVLGESTEAFVTDDDATATLAAEHHLPVHRAP